MKEYRNARFNQFGSIDCEIWVSELEKWWPFTASPEDPHGAEIFADSYGNAAPYTPPPLPPEPTPEELAEAVRGGMVCSRLQGRLVLGETTCKELDAMADDPNTPWAMRQAISNAIEWRRTSQTITELGYLLGYTDEQMDNLFRQAMVVEV
jgi:hypothetical protein